MNDPLAPPAPATGADILEQLKTLAAASQRWTNSEQGREIWAALQSAEKQARQFAREHPDLMAELARFAEHRDAPGNRPTVSRLGPFANLTPPPPREEPAPCDRVHLDELTPGKPPGSDRN